MSILSNLFDSFNNKNAQDAANAQISGITAGVNAATPAINTGTAAIKDYGAAGLQPFSDLYNGYALPGMSAYLNATGVTGDPTATLSALRHSPGYQFALDQGTENVKRQAASTGQLASGNTDKAIADYTTGLADQTYQNYVKNLLPFMSLGPTTATGIAQGNQWTGTGVNNNQNNLATLGYQSNVGMGNAQANADLAQQQADNNMWGLGLNIAKGFAGAGGVPGLSKMFSLG